MITELHGKDFFVSGEFSLMLEQLPYKTLPNHEPHRHDFSEMTLILKGNCVHVCNGKRVHLKEEDVLILHPGTIHSFEECEDMEAIALLYDANTPYAPLAASSLELMTVFYPTPDSPRRDEAEPVTQFPACDFGLILNLLLRLRYELRRKRLGHHLIIMAEFTEIMVYFARGYSQKQLRTQNGQLQKAINYMNEHFSEKVTIKILCREAGMSERAFFQQFKEVFHIPPCDYLIRLRAFRAMEMLQAKRHSIAEIALKCGFYDSNHFCKVFKQLHGRSPKNFRSVAEK